MSLAIEANGLTKDFEKGRRTIWLATEHCLRRLGTLGQHWALGPDRRR